MQTVVSEGVGSLFRWSVVLGYCLEYMLVMIQWDGFNIALVRRSGNGGSCKL